MWVFFCVLLVVFVLMFGPFCLELKNKRGRERFFEVSLRFCGLCIYRGVFMLHFKHVVRPQIIKVKKVGFKKIYAATIQKSKKSAIWDIFLKVRIFAKWTRCFGWEPGMQRIQR